MFEIEKYLGLWHEIKRSDNWFERDCVKATARYYKEKSKIKVLNSCVTENGDVRDISGIVRQKKNTGKDGQLEVSFSWFMGWAPYNVLWTDYDHMAVVCGAPGEGNWWILSRVPTLTAEQLAHARAILVKFGCL